MSRSVAYPSSPLLASRTPVWRSKMIVAAIALGFLALAGRAAWVQVFANQFYLHQGEVRFARTLELPATRGRIFDRNGLLLASSVPVPSIAAIPEAIDRDPARLAQLAKALQMPVAELNKRLEDEERSFVWLKRQVDEATAKQVADLDIKGVYERKEYRRQYPEGEAAAHVVGFTSVEDKGQEGMELAFDKDLAGRPRSRRVDQGSPRAHRRGHARAGAAGGRQGTCSCRLGQQGAVFRLPAVARRRAAEQGQGGQCGGAGRAHGRSAGAGQLPQLQPRAPREPHRWGNCATVRFPHGQLRARLHDEAHRGCRWRCRRAWSTPDTVIQTNGGDITISGLHHP